MRTRPSIVHIQASSQILSLVSLRLNVFLEAQPRHPRSVSSPLFFLSRARVCVLDSYWVFPGADVKEERGLTTRAAVRRRPSVKSQSVAPCPRNSRGPSPATSLLKLHRPGVIINQVRLVVSRPLARRQVPEPPPRPKFLSAHCCFTHPSVAWFPTSQSAETSLQSF